MSIPYKFNPLGISNNHKVVTYLESTGTQYINTGYVFDDLNKGSQLEIKLYLPSGVTTSNAMFGARQQANGKNSLYAIGYNLIVGDSEGFNPINAVFQSEQITTFRFKQGKYSINNGEWITVGRLPATQYPFALFCFNAQNNFTLNSASGTRIYYCKFSENGTIIKNLIPVIDRNNIPCMYDTVNKTYYYNSGTGVFNYGETPYLRQLSYIESTGTQYINLNLSPNDISEIEVIASKQGGTIGNFGCRSGSGYLEFRCTFGAVNIDIAYINHLQRTSDYDTSAINTYYMSTNGLLKVNGNTLANYDQAITQSLSIFLFAFNNNGTAYLTGVSNRIYGVKCTKNDNVIMQLIPIIDNNNTPCFYDKINNTYLYNAGTGDFLYG